MNDRRWDIRVLRQYIRNTDFEEERKMRLVQAADSIGVSFNRFYWYHRDQFDAALDELRRHMQTGGIMAALRFMLSQSKEQEKCDLAVAALQANSVAAMHVLRSSVDMYAQLENGLSSSEPLSPDRCDIASLYRQRERLSAEGRDRVATIVGSAPYSYVNAFVNIAKHRHLIQTPQSLERDAAGDQHVYGIYADAFSYRNAHFPRRPLGELFTTMDELIALILEAAVGLNQSLGLDSSP
tara:strand:+ start:970 stop:1686 length:717 start_codon:yes stop_codon:yes gene_type:complete